MKPGARTPRLVLDAVTALRRAATTLEVHGAVAWTRTADWSGRGYPPGRHSDAGTSAGLSIMVDGERIPATPVEIAALTGPSELSDSHAQLRAAITQITAQAVDMHAMVTRWTRTTEHAVEMPCSVPHCADLVTMRETEVGVVKPICDPCAAYHRHSGMWPTRSVIQARLRKRSQRTKDHRTVTVTRDTRR